jgi:hypothetical protein
VPRHQRGDERYALAALDAEPGQQGGRVGQQAQRVAGHHVGQRTLVRQRDLVARLAAARRRHAQRAAVEHERAGRAVRHDPRHLVQHDAQVRVPGEVADQRPRHLEQALVQQPLVALLRVEANVLERHREGPRERQQRLRVLVAEAARLVERVHQAEDAPVVLHGDREHRPQAAPADGGVVERIVRGVVREVRFAAADDPARGGRALEREAVARRRDAGCFVAGPLRDELVGLGVVEGQVAGLCADRAGGAARDGVVAVAHFLVEKQEGRIFGCQCGASPRDGSAMKPNKAPACQAPRGVPRQAFQASAAGSSSPIRLAAPPSPASMPRFGVSSPASSRGAK